MRSVTQTKSLRDMRTTISTHARSVPRQKGSTYLEVYLLDKEKQRLQTELEMLGKRQARLQERVEEIGKAAAELVKRAAGAEELATSDPQAARPMADPSKDVNGRPGRWRTVEVEY